MRVVAPSRSMRSRRSGAPALGLLMLVGHESTNEAAALTAGISESSWKHEASNTGLSRSHHKHLLQRTTGDRINAGRSRVRHLYRKSFPVSRPSFANELRAAICDVRQRWEVSRSSALQKARKLAGFCFRAHSIGG